MASVTAAGLLAAGWMSGQSRARVLRDRCVVTLLGVRGTHVSAHVVCIGSGIGDASPRDGDVDEVLGHVPSRLEIALQVGVAPIPSLDESCAEGAVRLVGGDGDVGNVGAARGRDVELSATRSRQSGHADPDADSWGRVAVRGRRDVQARWRVSARIAFRCHVGVHGYCHSDFEQGTYGRGEQNGARSVKLSSHHAGTSRSARSTPIAASTVFGYVSAPMPERPHRAWRSRRAEERRRYAGPQAAVRRWPARAPR